MDNAPDRDAPGSGLPRVVVAIDASAYATTVLEAAARLPYAATEASIHVVHVIRWGMGYSVPTYALLERHGQEVLQRSAQTLESLLPPPPGRPRVETSLVFGTAFVEIVRHARECRAELVVVGRHGERKFLDALIGSTAERVVRKGSCPTLVVSPLASRPHARPLVGLDLSDDCRRAFTFARRLVAPDVAFDVVHVVDDDADPDDAATHAAIEDAVARCAGSAARGAVVVRAGDPRAVLLDEARGRGSDLLVLGTHGRSAIAQMLIGSVAEGVVRGAPCDVLVARSGEHHHESV